ncbi:MAG: CAP domain-containing protein [Gillisia sp.]
MIFLCVFSLSSCTKDSISPEESAELKTVHLVDAFAYSQIELDILTAVNDYRKSKGLKILKRVDEITVQAESHTVYMVEKNVVNHDNFNVRFANLVEEIGARAVSENVGFGYSTANAVVRAWIESEGHLANIEGDFTHFGVSVEKDENEKNYFTNIFVRR